jgi:CDP-glucose 4,6-dehydratase
VTVALPDPAFWNGRRVLLTGHTGFKGSWLTRWLQTLGAEVMGISLPEPPTTPSLWQQLDLVGVADHRGDITTVGFGESVRAFAPTVVLHLAAQSLVSVGYAEPGRTFEVNVLGTVRVLEWVSSLEGVVATLVITTDKVYDPSPAPPHGESDRLGGREPYSASTAAAELVVAGWPAGAPRATARAGNVIGGGDWAANRLLPDLVRAWSAGTAPVLRYPEAVRPWQHVLEPLRGYLLYAEALASSPAEVAPSLNFGPADRQAVPVATIVEFAAGEWQRLGGTLPAPAWTRSSDMHLAETGELTLDSRLAAEQLGWSSILGWQEAVALTLEWYHQALAGVPADELVVRQLASYSALVRGAA